MELRSISAQHGDVHVILPVALSPVEAIQPPAFGPAEGETVSHSGCAGLGQVMVMVGQTLCFHFNFQPHCPRHRNPPTPGPLWGSAEPFGCLLAAPTVVFGFLNCTKYMKSPPSAFLVSKILSLSSLRLSFFLSANK